MFKKFAKGGSLNKKSTVKVLKKFGEKCDASSVEAIFARFDLDNDGAIDVAEFETMYTAYTQPQEAGTPPDSEQGRPVGVLEFKLPSGLPMYSPARCALATQPIALR